MPGTLYLVSTPIGNLGDISLRAIATLRKVHRIIAEDTRNTRHLLSRYRITTPFTTSYYDGVEDERVAALLGILTSGEDLALVSDAGTPLISDPGYPLVREAINSGIKVVPIPGPTALISSLVASGLPTDRFVFDGALPRKDTRRYEYLRQIVLEQRTIIVHSSPHRLFADLEAIATVMPNRYIVLAREMTKLHEEFIRGTPEEVVNRLRARGTKIRGEVVLILQGAPCSRTESDDEDHAEKLALILRQETIPTKAALRILMSAFNLKRNDAYRLLHRD